MDKPISMPVKDYLMRVMSVRTNTPLKTIEAVIEFQMQGANEALVHNYSVELSGFGKFIFGHKKAQKKMEKNLSKKEVFEKMLLNPDISETKRASLNLKLENTIKFIEGLKPKLNGMEPAFGGLEELNPPISTGEGINRTDISEEK